MFASQRNAYKRTESIAGKETQEKRAVSNAGAYKKKLSVNNDNNPVSKDTILTEDSSLATWKTGKACTSNSNSSSNNMKPSLVGNEISISTSMSSPPKNDFVVKAQTMLRGMRKALEALVQQESDFAEVRKVHQDRAEARYAAKNTTGAVLSLRKLQNNQVELDKVAQAMDYLHTQVMEVSSKLHQAQAVRTLQEAGDQENTPDKSSHNSSNSSLWTFLERFDDYAKHVESILSKETSSPVKSDEELLQALAEKLEA